jgi:glycosyltransferase involved in cell wall biosynthesis
MKIGIDISQSIYNGTGVAEYVNRLVEKLLEMDEEHEYVLFFSHHKVNIQDLRFTTQESSNVTIKSFPLPISVLEFLWNRLHIVPIEWFIGDVDVFYTSDWVEPPTRNAKKITTIHDLSVLKVPETFDQKIIDVHSRKLKWVVKESDAILCDSEATRNDVIELLKVEKERLHVVYPGI